VRANIGPAVLTYLMIVVITFVGALICGVGLLVALPVAMLFLVYAWRRLTGGPIAALQPQPLPPHGLPPQGPPPGLPPQGLPPQGPPPGGPPPQGPPHQF